MVEETTVAAMMGKAISEKSAEMIQSGQIGSASEGVPGKKWVPNRGVGVTSSSLPKQPGSQTR